MPDINNPKKRKQAVVIIHGIGEQRPMETVRTFIRSIWDENDDLGANGSADVWSKPSSLSQSGEQRRLTTNYTKANSKGIQSRTDFYEYYWAHQTVGTKWEHFIGWFKSLLLRLPGSYPKGIRHVWWALITLTAIIIYAICQMPSVETMYESVSWSVICNIFWTFIDGFSFLFTGDPPLWDRIVEIAKTFLTFIKDTWPFIIAIVSTLLAKTIVAYLGDVARYVQAKPANIKIRHAIRSDGIEMLEELMQSHKGYDRIILVSHSLGTIIAYDILNHLWSRHNKLADPVLADPEGQKITEKMEELSAIKDLSKDQQREYRELQNLLFVKIRDMGQQPDKKWLISDFVTIGSALTHTEFLVAGDPDEFIRMKKDREYPTCPPVLEDNRFRYGTQHQHLHHATVFAPVRWTNVYDPHKFILFGDLISGKVGKSFSPHEYGETEKAPMSPILDIDAKIIKPTGIFKRFFTHTEYWAWHDSYKTNVPEHIKTVRQATNIMDEGEARW